MESTHREPGLTLAVPLRIHMHASKENLTFFYEDGTNGPEIYRSMSTYDKGKGFDEPATFSALIAF